MRGEIPAPPFELLTGLHPVAYERGEAVYELPISNWLLDSTGIVSSGVLAFAADAPFGGAPISNLPVGAFISTSEISMNYIRPVLPSAGKIVARATLVHMGRSFALSEARLEDQSGALLAHGTARNLLMHFPVPDELPAPIQEPPEQAEFEPPYLRPVRGETLSAESWRELSGLEIVRRQAGGELPEAPLSNLFGMRKTEVEEGKVTIAMPTSRWIGVVGRRLFGGATALACDWAMFYAVTTTMPPAAGSIPLDLKVQYLRPVTADGSDFSVRATVFHRGQRLAICNAELITAEGKVAAVATGSFLIVQDFVWPSDGARLAGEGLEASEEEPAG
jgi:uncharacterized protein (TIGR00369 family)